MIGQGLAEYDYLPSVRHLCRYRLPGGIPYAEEIEIFGLNP